MSIPFPKNPEEQAEAEVPRLSQQLEKLAERYHTTPDTIVALNGPDKLIGDRPDACGCPTSSRPRATMPGCQGNGAAVSTSSTSTPRQPQGDYVVVDKSEGVLKVYRGSTPAVEGDSRLGSSSPHSR